MFKTAKPAYSALLSEMPGNAYDARHWLSKRRDARRAAVPFTPIQNIVPDICFDEVRRG